MKPTDVFTPTKLPNVTFIGDHLENHSKILKDSLAMGAAVISLSGPSKSGKTVFIENQLGKENLIQVTGAGIDTPQKLWGRVFDLIGTPIHTKVTSSNNLSESQTTKLTARLPAVLSVDIGGSLTSADNQSVTQDYATDYLQLLIKELGNTDWIVFIDDFHYINRDAQREIANQIKEAVRGGVKFICASVPYHSDDVIRANSDLRGRIVNLDFDYWGLNELKKIAGKGFDALEISFPEAVIDALASEAAGSPQLMQFLCLNSCFEGEIENHPKLKLPTDLNGFIKRVCNRTCLAANYSSTVEKMSDGPKTRGNDRKSYSLKHGTSCDVYPLILLAISEDPPELTIRYSKLKERIDLICSGEVPSGSSITGACENLSIIANNAEDKMIIEWDSDSDVLDIRDPYLLFFLRWGDWH